MPRRGWPGPPARSRPTGRSGSAGLAATDGANALRLDHHPVDLVAPDESPWTPDASPWTVDEPLASPHGQPVAAPDFVSTVAPPAPVLVPRASFVALVLTLVVTGVLGVLVINTKINENAFRLDDLHQRQAALDLQEQQLSGQLADLESPGNLAAAARRLGLVPAGTPAYIRLPDGRVLGVPQPATAPNSAGAGSTGQ